MAHIVSAGNSGAGANTIGSPATAKNVITVGATEGVRANGVVDGCGVSAADNSNDIIDFSSRGPTDDGRTKPDIVAPGTHIVGPIPSGPDYNGSGTCNPQYPAGSFRYGLASGTSNASPAVAGAASLIYNYYQRTFGGTPSPAMLKAFMLNTTRYLTGVDSGDTLPSNNQGWGAMFLKQGFDTTPKYVRDQTSVFVNTGNIYLRSGRVAIPSKPFRVTVAWTDAIGPTTGNAYVNDLNLEVTSTWR
jgi:subtilisin family serine protease